MEESKEVLLDADVGRAIKRNRLRAGLTQVQLARALSRSGKFLSEVESGKARITQRDLEKLADAMGISGDKMFEAESDNGDSLSWDLPRRIRDVHPTGLTIMSFTQLMTHLDRSGWLRNAKLWSISADPFPEENDLALVEQVASLVSTKQVSLRYVCSADRLNAREREHLPRTQGTLDALPSSLLAALRWSSAMRPHIDPAGNRIVGYAATWPMPAPACCHTLLWVETEDVSWSDVMPLLYCRSTTRTFENPNETVAFWHHMPRELGSKILLDLAQKLKTIPQGRDASL